MATNSGLSEEELISKLVSKEIKFYEIEKYCDDAKKCAKIRLFAIERMTKSKFNNLGAYTISNTKPNIENMIGAVQVPVGVAGPISIKGEFTKGEFYLPLATTEGALIASINRGCSLINSCGGANVTIIKNSQTRSILFRIDDINKIKDFYAWIDKNIDSLKKTGESTSRFLEISEIRKYCVSDNIWLRISADTKDAMGMNMITLAAQKIGEYVESNFSGIVFLSESGNMCVDKKPSSLNLAEGKGKTVIASARLNEDKISKYLKTTSRQIYDLNYRKNLLGSALSGSIGFNAHFANMVAAIYLATGQDMAHVVEGSNGFTTIDLTDEGIIAAVTLPSIQVGTIGGGTGIETQNECLNMLGCSGSGNPPGANSSKLAEIVACSVLAGEISLLGALSARHLTKAHLELNR